MGTTRVCGKQCHAARRAKCRCWCGGLFHGKGGEPARAAFRASFDVTTIPTTEKAFNKLTQQPSLFDERTTARCEHWQSAIKTARGEVSRDV